MRPALVVRKALLAARTLKLKIDPRVAQYSLPKWDRAERTRPLRIGIVGAGIAGLVTARLLKDLGYEVTVLEAQDRVGGRLHTIRVMEDPSLVADAGATRFSESHSHTMYWLRRFNIALSSMYPESGSLVRLSGATRQVGRDVAYLSSHDVHGLIHGIHTWESQYRSLKGTATAFIGDTLTKPRWYRIAGGASTLPKALASTLEPNLRLNTAVDSIVQRETCVDVRTGEDTHTFDRVVLTVPAAVYDAIEFAPHLTPQKLADLRNLRTQPSLRFFVALRGETWKDGGLCGWGCTDERLEVWNLADKTSPSRSVVVLYGQGDAATPLVSMSKPDRERRMLEMFEAMFPSATASIVGTHSHCWNDDPWAKGAQSLDRGALWEPYGRLHFAGESTAREGWVDGTIASAYRVVGEISNAVRKYASIQKG